MSQSWSFDTMISDKMAHQQTEPHGLTITPNDEEDTRRSNLRRWRADGLCDLVGTFPTARDAEDVRALVIEYIDRHGYDAERACAQAMIEYGEAQGGAI